MRKLNGMVMRPNQDPDKYLTRGFRQHDDLEHIDESLTEGRMLDFILVGLSDEYKPIQLAAKRDPEISLKKLRLRCVTCTPPTSRAVTAG